jgi:hypothetical protein
MKEKQILIGRQVPRYRCVKKKTKTKILDGFAAAAGYNRKYALHILTHWRKKPSPPRTANPSMLYRNTASATAASLSLNASLSYRISHFPTPYGSSLIQNAAYFPHPFSPVFIPERKGTLLPDYRGLPCLQAKKAG